MKYEPSKVEPKWQKIWEEKKTFKTPRNPDPQKKSPPVSRPDSRSLPEREAPPLAPSPEPAARQPSTPIFIPPPQAPAPQRPQRSWKQIFVVGASGLLSLILVAAGFAFYLTTSAGFQKFILPRLAAALGVEI